MPTLPDPTQSNRPELRPSTGIVNVQTGVVEGARAARAGGQMRNAQDVGRAAAGFSSNIMELADRKRRELVDLQADEAEAKAYDKTTELLTGEDGALHVKEGGVLSKNYIKKYADSFEAHVKATSEALPTDEHRAAFKPRADKLRSQLLKNLAMHSMQESDRYQDTVTQGQRASFLNYAQAQAGNADATEQAAKDMREMWTKRLAQQGVVDSATVEAKLLQEEGAVHASVVDALRRSGRVTEANQYLAKVYQEKGTDDPVTGMPLPPTRRMTEDQAQEVQAKLRPVTEAVKGAEYAKLVVSMREQGKSAKEIAAAQEGLSPGERDAVQRNLNAYEHEANVQSKTVKANVINGFHKAGSTSQAMEQALSSDLFLDSPPEDQNDMYRYLQANADLAEGRTESKAVKDMQRRWSSPETSRLYLSIVNDENFTQRTPEEISGMADALGPKLTQNVMAEYNRRLAGAAKYRLPDAMLNAAMPEKLKKSNKKNERDAWLGVLQANLADWQTANPGKVPTVDEQKALAQSPNKVYDAGGWFTGEKRVWQAPEDVREEIRQRAGAPSTPARQAESEKQVQRLMAARQAAGKPITRAQAERMYDEYRASGQ